jgi:predicted Ser/Thr protein kinase
VGVEALKSINLDEVKARLKENGYSEKAIEEIMRWYQG